MQAPVLTDTEPENSIDLDKVCEERLLSSINSNATKSVFNISLNDALIDSNDNSATKSYEDRLEEEKKSWSREIKNIIDELKLAKKKHPVVDDSVLSADRRAYLEKAPILANFVWESLQFRQAAYKFLKKDCADMQEMHDEYLEICDHTINVCKEAKLLEEMLKP